MHCKRVTYQSYIWKHAYVPSIDILSPIGLGWKLNEEGQLAVPPQLLDILAEASSTNVRTEEIEQQDMDPDEIIYEQVEDECEIENILDVIFEEDEDEE